MPNDCCCTVRLYADKSTIDLFKQTEFSFMALHPQPTFDPIPDVSGEDTRWYEWRYANWGTKWDRYNFRFEHKGSGALEMKFTTAWDPPYHFFAYLLGKYPDLWLKCDWIEEGGEAGVFVGRTKEGEVEIKNLEWSDWCLEMFYGAFDDDDEIVICPRSLEECGSMEEFKKELMNPSLKMTQKEWRERKEGKSKN
jgi:hypothetical protein